MGYSHGKQGRTGGTVKKTSNTGSGIRKVRQTRLGPTGKKITIPKIIIPKITIPKKEITSMTSRNINKLPTWKGDPNNKVAIDAWKKSYEPGYTPQIISPRNSSGKYTSDPKETVSYIAMDQITHAKEIAIALQSEPKIPMSIVDSLKKTLGDAKEKIKGDPPIATTTTKMQSSEARHLTDFTYHKLTAITIGVFVIIFASLHLLKKG